MSRRIDVELTSQSDDGTWTWRAAGAKQPKGTLDGALLYSGAAVGDVCRAEADFEIDGIFITAVMPAKGRSGRPDDERLELLGSTTEFQGVTTQLAKKGRSGKKKTAAGGMGARKIELRGLVGTVTAKAGKQPETRNLGSQRRMPRRNQSRRNSSLGAHIVRH